ncbi:MAG: hypothetical protein HYU52_06585 [Acidobacteria bacterium]|nr:hypothetical protein [Acidobacteriota bacterium]
MQIVRALVALVVTLMPLGALAQSISEEWRTLHTEHFRVHFPIAYEPWAREVASKLESIRTTVNSEIGYAPEGVTEVVVADPIAQANGSAWPILGAPRMVFWASPPSPAGALGHESDWGELLAIHEWTHVAHLVRPSRSRFAGARWLFAPVALGPITRAPRWISEGYATVLEGKLTGQGRPFSDYRAVILRTWAQRGRLPSYEQLDKDSANWMGMSMAYLVGSAYLEWLVEREGDESLPKLWARLTARQSRTFDEAFQGVYGETPKRLYQRFAAELIHRSMVVEAAVAASQRPGDLWMDVSWTTGEPDLNLDGSRLVTIVRAKRKPARLVIYSTDRDAKAEAAYSKRVERILARDPEDVAPVRNKPLPRTPEAEHVLRPGEVVGNARWIGSTGDVLFVRFTPDRDGFLHPDIYRWSPASAAPPTRLTDGADLRDVRPAADGSYALAIRNRYGMSEVVRIDLQDGSVTPIEGPSLHEQFVEPAPHPTLPVFAIVMRKGGTWRLVVRGITSAPNQAELAFDGIVAQPSWSRDGKALFATVARNGFVEISRFDYDVSSGALVERGQVTRGSGASLAAVASNDALWFLALDPDGLDLRKLPIAETEQPLPSIATPPDAAPAVRRSFDGTTTEIRRGELGESVPYGFGRQEVSLLFGGSLAPSGEVVEVGARVGDVLGRLETLAFASAGYDGGVEGASISIKSKKYPIEIGSRLFIYDERPTDQRDGDLSRSRDNERFGIETWISKGRRWSGGGVNGSVALYAAKIEAVPTAAVSQLGSSVATRIEHAPVVYGGNLLPMALALSGNSGSTDGDRWTRFRGGLSLGFSSRGRGVAVTLDAGSVSDDASWTDQFEIGGARLSLHPEAATSNRVDVPALPAGILRGNSFDSVRVDLRMGGVMPTLFAQRVGANVDSGDDEIQLAGLEWTLQLDSMPLVRIPALELRAGVARVLDHGLLDDETSVWMTMRWKP